MSVKAIALHDCTADDDAELSFKKGDRFVDVVESGEEGWLEAKKEGTNERGVLPKNYVQLIIGQPSPRPIKKTITANISKESPSSIRPSLPPKPSSELIAISASTNSEKQPPSISKNPKKLPAGVFATFETNNTNSNLFSQFGNKPAASLKPKEKMGEILTDKPEMESEVEPVLPSVSDIRKALEQKSIQKTSGVSPSIQNTVRPKSDINTSITSRSSAALKISPRPESDPKMKLQSKFMQDGEVDTNLVQPSTVKRQNLPFVPPKPLIKPPIIGSKPSLNKNTSQAIPANKSSFKPPSSSRELEDAQSSNSNDKQPTGPLKRPILPPRKLSNSSISNEFSEGETSPPKIPPRPSPLEKAESSVLPNYNLNDRLNKAETETKIKVQNQAAEGAKKGVSAGFKEGQDRLNTSLGGRKLPGQDKLFGKVEKFAQAEAEKKSRITAGDKFDDHSKIFKENAKSNMNSLQRESENGISKNSSLSDRIKGLKLSTANLNNNNNNNNSNNNSNNYNNNNLLIPPPLPVRKNTVNSSTDVTSSPKTIPPRPPQHNPFSEHNLSKGIPADARKRYEQVFEAKQNREGYIDGEVVKDIYVKSRLDSKTLHKIWNLVDTRKIGKLNKQEFSAGMFLIDERLKGIPVPDNLPRETLNLFLC
ncbi:hypothetical protein G9A89_012571 [Geosiphon pyriformis]|nr:hypothetical protein G9A89_012571 [Geosiphon pyriformis]